MIYLENLLLLGRSQMNENIMEAFLAELVLIRKAIESLTMTVSEGRCDLHDDLQDIVASIDGFNLAAASTSIDDEED